MLIKLDVKLCSDGEPVWNEPSLDSNLSGILSEDNEFRNEKLEIFLFTSHLLNFIFH